MKVNANTKSLEGLQRLCFMCIVYHCAKTIQRKDGHDSWKQGGHCKMELSLKEHSWSYWCFGGCDAFHMSLQLSMQRASQKKKYLALCLTVTRQKCLTFCFQNWVVRLETMKLNSFSDGMLLCSIYHLAFNFFPRVTGQRLESSITTSSCLW